MNFSNLNIGASLNLGAAPPSPGIGAAQSFSTRSIPNNGVALFALAIFMPSSNQPVASYIFPISPTDVSKEFTGMSAYYDVGGSPGEFGVHRVVDSYGNSPLNFSIRGTTGFQYHSTDRFGFTGVQSISLFVEILNRYAQINATLQVQGNPTAAILEMYDYYAGDFWSVVPIGRQQVQISNQQPLIFNYNFRLVGISNLEAAITHPQDPVLQSFSTPASQTQTALRQQTGLILSDYTPTGTP